MHHAYLAALVTAAMGVAFILADPKTPTSRALSFALLATGLSIAGNTFFFLSPDAAIGAGGWLVPLADALALGLAYEWVARLRRTIPGRAELNTRFGDRLVRVAQLCVGVYLLLSLLFPAERAQYFVGGISLDAVVSPGWFYLFSLPLDFSMLCGGAAMLLLLNRKPDAAERKRLIAVIIALPVMLAGLMLPIDWAPFVTVLGAMILLVGAVQYHVEQGRRSEFLGRFLSPAVAGMVRAQGLDAVGRETREITAVLCDIRGFTRRCRTLRSDQILDLLRQFYAVVGRCCERHGATIKDYAGDGVMMLVGAPLPVVDTAACALLLARDLQQECAPLLRAWSEEEAPIGLAVGVATGPVTLGVIGALRLEYVAVGATVNLAARLCESAGSGEILVDAPRAGEQLTERQLALKGFGPEVCAYSAS